MTKWLNLILITGMVVLLSSCSSAPRRKSDIPVFMTPQGVLQIKQTDPDIEKARSAALKQASQYCGFDNQTAMIIEEKSDYHGTFDKETDDLVRMAGDLSKKIGIGQASEKIGNVTKDAYYDLTLYFDCK